MCTQKPNILFFLPDQHRPDWLGCNSDLPVRTPNLDRLARKGMHFTSAFTPSPVCSPARACLATGRDYGRCGVQNNRQNTPLSMPTYYQALRDSGYEVAGVGKFDLHKPDLDWGLDGSNMLSKYGFTAGIDNEGKGDAILAYVRNGYQPKGPYMQFLQERDLIDRHFDMYKSYFGKSGWLNSPAVTDLPDDAYCDNWIAASGIHQLRNFPKDKPWHLVVNFVGPHGPFDVTSGMRERWANVEFPPPNDSDEPNESIILERRQNYAAMIEKIDAHVGRMIQEVEERGELDRTIIVYASDHGEMLGDHGRWGKTLWYTPSSGIPLIASGPGIRSGITSLALVALHDLAATFLDYAGAQPLPDMEALSMRALLEGTTEEHREYIFCGLDEWRMVFDGRYKLVTGAQEFPLLYDLEKDPNEILNAASGHPQIVGNLSRKIASQPWITHG